MDVGLDDYSWPIADWTGYLGNGLGNTGDMPPSSSSKGKQKAGTQYPAASWDPTGDAESFSDGTINPQLLNMSASPTLDLGLSSFGSYATPSTSTLDGFAAVGDTSQFYSTENPSESGFSYPCPSSILDPFTAPDYSYGSDSQDFATTHLSAPES